MGTVGYTWAGRDSQGNARTGSGSIATVGAEPTGSTSIGMSSPKDLWDQRYREVGADGLTSQRIYCDVNSSGIATNLDRIQKAISLDLTPVVSFKFPSASIAAVGRGDCNAWAAKAADQLQALGVTSLVAAFHEPYDNMSGPEFLATQRQLLPVFNARSNIETYCILHGWLLDNESQMPARFTAYMAPDVMEMLTYFGIDSYQSGTMDSPGDKDLSTRMPTLLKWLRAQGAPDKPVVIGEFSGYTAASMRKVGEAILSTPNVRYALLFNSASGGKGEPVVPNTDRMTAFQAIKADPRAKR